MHRTDANKHHLQTNKFERECCLTAESHLPFRRTDDQQGTLFTTKVKEITKHLNPGGEARPAKSPPGLSSTIMAMQ
ncbi:hypothetical protein AOXY_G13950 [Acipenser oxyrinchus oxyrinchus]|uniref:Uncharacterized protein n=1 Tax=Acipenser oxyrinchus oxyrinchus TaxID=40147 RepID=A0AAD8DB04_ACIOX|nr:hypothetical protein AOXY_G13950 [Acipenser oxyrinchus oxyrinchus]